MHFHEAIQKRSDEEYYIDKRITLTAPEFQELINNVENVYMGSKKEDQKESATTKRSETSPQKNGNFIKLSDSKKTQFEDEQKICNLSFFP